MIKEDAPLLKSPGSGRYESFVAAGSSIIYCSADQIPEPDKPPNRRNSTYEHCHPPWQDGVDALARKKLIFASVLCLLFMILEVVGGLLANSLAIATDAAHLLTDFASFMISLFSLWLATRPATKRMSFGWYRAEVIGAVTSVLLIWVVTGVLVFMAVQRIINEDYDIDATIMLITAVLGIVVNIIMGIGLHAGGMSHSHNTSNDQVTTSARGNRNLNVRAALVHVIGDLLQSLGVFVAALIIYFKPQYRIADPLCTFLFSILVLLTTLAILREALTVLMEGKPNSIDFRTVLELLAQQDGVYQVHNLRIWALSMDKIALSAHIVIGPNQDGMRVLKNSSRMIRSNFDIFEMTLQVEEYNQGMDDCAKCNDSQN